MRCELANNNGVASPRVLINRKPEYISRDQDKKRQKLGDESLYTYFMTSVKIFRGNGRDILNILKISRRNDFSDEAAKITTSHLYVNQSSFFIHKHILYNKITKTVWKTRKTKYIPLSIPCRYTQVESQKSAQKDG